MPKLIYTLIAMLWLTAPAAAQTDDDQQRSELGARQQLVARKMTELENRFTVIAERIREQEPDRYERLIKAYQQARENLLTRKMADITVLLDSGKYVEADRKLDEVVTSLDELVRLLLNNPSRDLDKQEEIAQLEQWKQEIRSLRDEQGTQRRETSKVANRESELEKLDGQIKKVDDLIDQQQELLEQAKKTEGAGLREMDRVADRQFELRGETERLAREVAGQAGGSKEEPSDRDGAGEQNFGGADQGDPGDSDFGDRQNPRKGEPGNEADSESDDQPEDGDSSDADSSPGNSESTPPGGQAAPKSDRSPGSQNSQANGQPPSAGGNQAPQPGEQPLQNSAQAQARAEEDLGSGRPKDAQREQSDALEQLKQARAELAKERRRLASLPPEATEQMAREQQRTRDRAMDLIEKMAKAPAADGSDQQVGKQDSPPQPGQQATQQAAESMQQATDDLESSDPQQAEQKQREAEQKLEEALDEIEERLNQLRDETREEKLKRLEGRFVEMLDRQRSVSAETIELNDVKLNLGELQRHDQLATLRLASEEAEIGELGQQAYDLLLEDGTSDVFPEMVFELTSDLGRSAELLQDERTGQLTQLLQQEIESTLIDLLQALEESKEEGQQSGGGGGGGGGDQPLLKRSAELKMLKAAQQRLNRKTRQLDSIRSTQPDQTDAQLDQEVEGLSDSQSKLQQMAEQIMEKGN